MKIKLLLLLLLSISGWISAQQIVIGKVVSEDGRALPGVTILNARTDEKVVSNSFGDFSISARTHDELRLSRSGYDRVTKPISAVNFSAPLNIVLLRTPYDIAAVEIAPQLTGVLAKDIKNLGPPKRVIALNSAMNLYMMTPLTQPLPKLTVPSAFAPPNMNAGMVDLGALASLVGSVISRRNTSKPTKANYAETQAFYRQIKNSVDLTFYTKQGWTEEDIDRFIIYADRYSDLAKKYRKDFNAAVIEREMKVAYVQYVKSHKVGL